MFYLLLDHVTEDDELTSVKADGKPVLDVLLRTLLQNINSLIAVGNLARARRAVLLNWKVISSAFTWYMHKGILTRRLYLVYCTRKIHLNRYAKD